MNFDGIAAPLSEDGLQAARDELDIDAPALWAVVTVETRGCGFLPDRRPAILFERHIFRRLTEGVHDADHPDISNRSQGGYGAAGAHQYERLDQAIALNRIAALQSTSWGLGQVMGFNATAVGLANVDALVQACKESEDAQLNAMVAFIRQAGIARHLKDADWAKFAYAYNGTDFQKNKYDEKLDFAHKRYLHGPLPDLTVRTAQLGLMILGYGSPGFVDGWFGVNTQKALVKYQRNSALPVTGNADPSTVAKLKADLGW